MIYYLIRHKATGEIMPLFKKNKGYSHWNPGRAIQRKLVGATEIPRFLKDRKQAEKVISMWFAFQNGKTSFSQNLYGDYEDSIDFKNDDRKKEDLEIVKVRIQIL